MELISDIPARREARRMFRNVRVQMSLILSMMNWADSFGANTVSLSDRLIGLEKEAEKAAAVIGAKHLKLDFPDCELHYNLESVTKTVDVIRQARPDVIITHFPSDYMPDHVITSQVVFDASFHATLPNFSAGGEPTGVIPPIYYMDTLAGVEFLPEEYVDVTETMETKRQMLLCHQSQYQWLKKHDNIDTVEFIETMARMRGLQCGAKYAEGFRRCKVWGRNPTSRLLP